MKIKKKALLLFLCAAVLVISSVFGTMAYLTDTEEAANTFTVGSVNITLDEAKVNENGKPVKADGTVVQNASDAERVTGNNYHLLPGHEYTKDPTVTVEAGSEEAYVRIKAIIKYREEAEPLFGEVNEPSATSKWLDIQSDKWMIQGVPTTTKTMENNVAYVTRTYEFRYVKKIKPEENKDLKLTPLFTKITVPSNLDNSDMEKLQDLTIHVVAHAMQADGFETEVAAWKAFDEQKQPVTNP